MLEAAPPAAAEERVRRERSGRARSGEYPTLPLPSRRSLGDGRLHLIDSPLDVEPLRLPSQDVGQRDLDVVVPVDRPPATYPARALRTRASWVR